MWNKEVSVIVPTYNSEKYLHKCVTSILNQSFSKFELILVNDGSTDNTQKLCEEYALRDKRIHVINQTNMGVAKAREAGLSIAQGKYIIYIDVDDYVKEDYIEVLYKQIEECNVDIVCCNYYVVTPNLCVKEENIKKEEYRDNIKELLNDYFFGRDYSYVVWGKIYKSEILKKAQFLSLKYLEDTYMIVSLFPHIEAIKLITYSGYYYQKRENSITACIDWIEKTKDMLILAEYVLRICKMYNELETEAVKQLQDYLFAAVVKHYQIATQVQMEELNNSFFNYYEYLCSCYKGGFIKKIILSDFAKKTYIFKPLILLYYKYCKDNI